MDTPPKQVDGEPDREERFVNLPGLISDEFGTPRSLVRMEIALGEIRVGGERWEGDQEALPYSAIEGKDIEVIGKTKHYRLTYRG